MAETEKERGTLNTVVNQDVVSGMEDPAVKDCLKMMNDNFTEKNKRDVKNQAINDLFTAGFTVREPNGPRKINSKKLMQAIWSTITKLKLLDFEFHGSQADEWEESLLTEGMGTVLKKGRYDATFKEKGGSAFNLLMYGDVFKMIGAKGEKGFPVEFTVIANNNLYTDTRATAIRGGNKPSTKVAAVFSGSWDQFCSLFPKMKKKAGPGRIPREFINKELNQTTSQRITQDKDLTEWCYYYDIEHKNHTLFAGSKCTVIKQERDEEYPFIREDDSGEEVPYIPVTQYSCIPSAEGFYNHGIAELIYDLIVLYAGIFNQAAQAVEDSVYPLEFVNLPNGEEAKFFEKLEMAYAERALGRRALIPIGQSATGSNGVTLQPFATTPLLAEATQLWDRIDLELKRIGIYLDESNPGANPTATQILAQIDQSNNFSRQIMEFNSPEILFEIETAMYFVKRFIKSNDKTPLNIATKVDGPDGQPFRPDWMTLGLLKKTLVERHWFVIVNDKTGYVPSSVMRREENSQLLPYLQPGSPEQQEVLKNLFKINRVDYKGPMSGPPQQGMPGAQGGAVPQPSAGRGQLQGVSQPPGEVANDTIRFRQMSQV